VLPKPLQKPHPPMWMAATNPESFEVAGRNGLGILCFVVGDPENLGPLVRIYRDAIKEADPAGGFVNENVAAFVLAHVAEDGAQARAVGGEAAVWYMECAMEFFAGVAGKKAYEAYAKILGDAAAQFEQLAERYGNKVDALSDMNVICVGDPDDAIRVAERFQAQGADQLIMLHQMGRIPHENVMHSIGLTGEHVIPRFRDAQPLDPGTKVLVAG
jgi:alkanesulfonate monooxygenase SsuD/methylene tetrahydromethanopterin reductase-like flavin-dependent oxidoreductase (luciferase family)